MQKMQLNIDDIENTCRTCLSQTKSNLKSLFDDCASSNCLVDKLMSCTFVQFSHVDGLPDKICLDCIEEINNSYKFAQKCEESDSVLRYILCQPKYKNKKKVSIEVQHNEKNNGDKLSDKPEIEEYNIVHDFLQIPSDSIRSKKSTYTKSETPVDASSSAEQITVNLRPEDLVNNVEIEEEVIYLSDNDNFHDYAANSTPMLSENDENYPEPEKVNKEKVVLLVETETKATDEDTNKKVSESEQNVSVDVQKSVKRVKKRGNGRIRTRKPKAVKKKLSDKVVEVSDEQINIVKKESTIKINIIDEPKVAVDNDMDADDLKDFPPIKKKRRRYPCPHCDRQFASASLPGHIRTHTKDKPYMCPTCGKCFSLTGNLRRHQMLHTGVRPHVCRFEGCGRSFIQRVTLQDHERTHTKEKAYVCEHCGKAYIQRPQLILHIKLHHPADEEDDDSKRKLQFQCPKCPKLFSSKATLYTHRLRHDNVRFACKQCGKLFTFRSSLSTHMKTHSGIKPYICVICGKGLAQLAGLKAHMRIHSREKNYECHVCNRKFTQGSHLKTHLLTHTGEKSFSCHICGKCFALNGNLTVHMRIHTGTRPYSCDKCDKSFFDSSSLKKHKKSHKTNDTSPK